MDPKVAREKHRGWPAEGEVGSVDNTGLPRQSQEPVLFCLSLLRGRIPPYTRGSWLRTLEEKTEQQVT